MLVLTLKTGHFYLGGKRTSVLWVDKSLMAWHLDRRGLLEEGEAIGRAYGLAEGEIKGKEEERLKIAKLLLKKDFPLSTISELTGLSDADIDRLKL